jgi:methanogenic corrinoid protein MtbC1
MLSIGDLARVTGIPVNTLRTWEQRYGFPQPVRKPSGHRLYPVSTAARLTRIAAALARGFRAAQVLAASDGELDQLLETAAASSPAAPPAAVAIDDLLRLVERMEAEPLSRALRAEAARLAPLEFLRDTVVPLVQAVGQGWCEGRLAVRHEHMLAARLGDVLRALRLGWDERASGAVVVLGTLPGELHELGLHMAALVLAVAGCRTVFLGAGTPVPELVHAAVEAGAAAVAVSVSSCHRGAATARALRRLRSALPRRVRLLVGGDGAPAALAGAEIIGELDALATWGRALR